jgi:hypothetical protein
VLDLESKAKTVWLGSDGGGRIQVSTNPERVGEAVSGDVRLASDEAVVITASPQ